MPRGVSRYDEAARQGRLWTPAELRADGSLYLWLDASDFSTLTLDSSNGCSQWNDKSGRGKHATQATAVNRPIYDYAQRALTWTDNNTAIFLDSTLQAGDVADWYGMFLLTRASSVVPFSAAISWRSGGPWQIILSDALGTSWSLNNADQTYPYSFGGVYTSGELVCIVYTVRSSSSGSYFKNGQYTANITNTGMTALSGTATLRIGGDQGFSTRYWGGKIYECGIVKGGMTDAMCRKLSAYLMWKYGAQSTLSGENPYSSRPPLIGD